jgi:hypothetical protein
MASGGAYDGALTPVVTPLTKEQRQRLESLTFARKLVEASRPHSSSPDINDWLKLARYIDKGLG